ncbi:MAG: hypothetical protein AMXMBFR58_20920 [Phycisphaerae bacterium]
MLAGAFTVACSSNAGFEQVRVADQSHAGTTHISVLSVVNWETASAKLQPKFSDLDWQDAYDSALVTTARTDERVLDSIAMAAGVGLPRTDRTVTTEKETDAEGTETSTRDVKESRVAGSAPDFEAAEGGNAAPRLDADSRKAHAMKEGTDLDLDPMIRYLAATALKQEVEMLNLYVDNALVPNGYTGYVVRLQVSLFPRARRLPYDAYTTLSFLPLEQREGSRQPTFNIASQKAINNAAPTPATPGSGAPGGVPPLRIVPLLVTDNLEAIRRSASRERLRDFVLGVTALFNGLDVKAQARSSLDEFQALLATDLNSLMTVGRASDNSVRVRFGASQVGPQQFSMVARTHNVTVLVLVPKSDAESEPGASTFSVVSRTEFVDANSGLSLPGLTRADQVALAAQAMQATGTPRGQSLAADADTLSKLLRFAEINDIASFRETLQPGEEDLSGYLWTDFVGIAASGPYAVTTVDVSKVKPADPVLPPVEHNTALLREDGGTTAVVLIGGRGLRESELKAELVLQKNNSDIESYPTRSIQTIDGASITVQFSGLARFLKDKQYERIVLRLVHLAAGRNAASGSAKPTIENYLATWLGRTSTIEFAFNARQIIADASGNGTLRVRVEDYENATSGSDSLGFRIEGADCALEQPTEIVTPGDGFFVVLKKGEFTLKLTNLATGKSIRFVPRIDGKDGKVTEISIGSNDQPKPSEPSPGGLKLSLVSQTVIVDGASAQVDLDFATGAEDGYTIYLPDIAADLAPNQDAVAKPLVPRQGEKGSRFQLLPTKNQQRRITLMLQNVSAGQTVTVYPYLKNDRLGQSVEFKLQAPGTPVGTLPGDQDAATFQAGGVPADQTKQ